MSHILQCVWPVLDESMTRSELIVEATADLDDLADQAHAVILGPGWWLVMPAEDVPGWRGYAPGSVLVANLPAVEWTADVDEIDWVCVERAIDGKRPKLNRAEYREAVRRLSERGLPDAVIGATLGRTRDTIAQLRRRWGIPSGSGCAQVSA